MSRERARTRAARQAAHEELLAQRAVERAAVAEKRRRQQQRQLRWRRVRLWQHGSSYRRNKERWAALSTLILCVVLVTYLVTRSLRDVLVVALIAVIASPVLVALIVNQRRS